MFLIIGTKTLFNFMLTAAFNDVGVHILTVEHEKAFEALMDTLTKTAKETDSNIHMYTCEIPGSWVVILWKFSLLSSLRHF